MPKVPGSRQKIPSLLWISQQELGHNFSVGLILGELQSHKKGVQMLDSPRQSKTKQCHKYILGYFIMVCKWELCILMNYTETELTLGLSRIGTRLSNDFVIHMRPRFIFLITFYVPCFMLGLHFQLLDEIQFLIKNLFLLFRHIVIPSFY